MNSTTKLGFAILSAALVLGLLGDALLRATPWGLNVGLWMAALILVGIALVRRQRIALTGDGRWMAAPALLFAVAFAWRDSVTLKSLDTLALLIALAFVLRHGRAGSLRIAGIADYASSLLLAALYAFSGPIFLLFRDIRWQALSRAR
jgi:hypothetical protein